MSINVLIVKKIVTNVGRYGAGIIVGGIVNHYVKPERIDQKVGVYVATVALTKPVGDYVAAQLSDAVDEITEIFDKNA